MSDIFLTKLINKKDFAKTILDTHETKLIVYLEKETLLIVILYFSSSISIFRNNTFVYMKIK